MDRTLPRAMGGGVVGKDPTIVYQPHQTLGSHRLEVLCLRTIRWGSPRNSRCREEFSEFSEF